MIGCLPGSNFCRDMIHSSKGVAEGHIALSGLALLKYNCASVSVVSCRVEFDSDR